MKNIKILQKFIKYILIYWFAFSIIPGMFSATNQIHEIAIMSIGFALIVMITPIFMSFFKFAKKNYLLKFIIVLVLSTIINFLAKPGITGIIYYPEQLSINLQFLPVTNINEFGIIGLIALVASVVFLILDYKEK